MAISQLEKEIAGRLEELRKSFKLGKKEFANDIYKDESQYSRMIQGRSGISVDVLFDVSSKYNASLEWLLSGEGDMLKRETGATTPDHLVNLLKNEIGLMAASLQRLAASLPKPVDPGTNVAGAPGFVKATSGKKEMKNKP